MSGVFGWAGALVGGVEGMLGEALLLGGFTEVSGVVAGGIADMSPDGVVAPVIGELCIGTVAEVSVAEPVEAEPDHQSLLARALGEAFR